MKKRIVSLLLVLVMLVSLFPAPVRATETDSNVDSGMTVEGTNGFGNLLSAELQAEYEEETQDTGNYSVLGLEITGNTAKVEYDSMEEAALVVALYSEDGMQLLTSGKTTVSPEDDTATVTIEGEMPEYFQASAYLVDTYDFSPLCASYDTPMYTREMQELLASTVEDYDADRVLQLDEDKTTNFAVYAEDTIVIEEQPGVNTVASVNDETSTYVIKNADESITSLRSGDVFAYPYGENEILIVKVASISVSGTTVTITGAELEMEEAFSHVKIEATGNTADMQVREDVVIDGVTFEGLVTDGVAPLAWDDSISVNKTLQYSLAKEVKSESDYAEASVEISGSLGLKLKVEFSYYISWQRQFLELGTEVQMEAKVNVTGKAAAKIPLTPFGFNPIQDLYIGFNPNLTLEFSGELSYSLSVSVAASLSYENEKGFNMQLKPDVESKLELEGSVFFGIDMNPGIVIFDGSVLDAEIAMPIGLKLEAKFAPKDTGTGNSIHSCAKCLDMDLKFEAKAEIKLKILDSDNLSKKKTYDFDFKFGDMYYSFDASRFGWGKCPYLKYRVTIQTCNGSGIVPNVAVSIDNVAVGTTDGKGVLTVYVPTGLHGFAATIDGVLCSHRANVSNAGKVVLKERGSFDDFGSIGDGIRDQTPGNVADTGNFVCTGTCGENVTWALTEDGMLIISGTGAMRNFDYYDRWEKTGGAPWHFKRASILSVVVEEGVTSIGDYAFYYCTSLSSITIPGSVTSIGNFAFNTCYSLSSITIPGSVTSIGNSAFGMCYSLSSITIPEGVTSIGDAAFKSCGLSSITISGSVTSMGDSAFAFCDSLSSVTIREGVTSIGDSAFEYCSSLSSITIPGSVTSIGYSAFDHCDSLSSVTIREGVTSIGGSAFQSCERLSSITIPGSVTSIGGYAFYDCDSLSSVTIREGVTRIGDLAFWGCNTLSSITIPGSVTSIGDAAFAGCGFSSITIPEGVTSIGDQAFSGCGILSSITIPGSVTSIGHRAFGDCRSLTGIWVNDRNQNYSNDEHGVLFNITKTELICAPGGISGAYSVPASVTSIGISAFYDCYSLSSITIPGSVTSIGDSAFEYCGLSSITISEGVTTIGNYAFYRCRSLESVTIPGSVTTLGKWAFNECKSLSSVTIPGSVTSIGSEAFGGCYSLSSVTIREGITSIGVFMFHNCSSLSSITIPEGVTSIGISAFSGCDSLSSITIPGSVTSIGDSAFSGCDSLSSITIPEGVPSIGASAFSGCGSLSSITIPGSVTSIGEYAFRRCDALSDVYYRGTEAQWDNITISGYNDNLTQARIHYNSTGPAAAPAETIFAVESGKEDIPQLDAVYGGEYDTGEPENYTLKTASFTGLVPGEEYLLLALKNLEAEDTLAANNLLYIDQAVAGEDGTLAFQYVQRTTAFVSYVMACGASNKNLNDAVITFPEMEANGELQVVDPTVTYDGKTLTEGEDYTILGDVFFTEAGDYTCYIRGIHSYTGLVTCPYTVTSNSENPPIEESTPTAPPVEETKPTEPEEAKPQPKPTEPEVTIPTEPEVTIPTEPEETKPQPKPTEPEDTKPTEPKYDNPFEDVFEADYYYDPVLWAVNEGITNGMDATHFAPAGTCTRSQIVTFLWRANGSPAAGGTNPFTDVPADAWYTDAVLWAVEEGITTGTSATTFSPDAGCTRGQVATFLWRSQGQPSVNGENIFTDIAYGAYYYDAVLWAVANGITNGMGEGIFAPDATCTRGQIVTFLYRAMNE